MTMLTMLAILGSALMGGVYFAFSVFVMAALGRLRPAAGLAAMQAINAAVINLPFAVVFLGTALAALGLIVEAVANGGRPGATARLAGGLLYLLGSFGLTLGFHVPRNNALARLSPDDPGSGAAWERYRSAWTAGNHLRLAASLLAAVALMTASGE